jgi:hypothetical protein
MMNATINQLLEALHLAQTALNIQPRFRVHNTDSYRIAAQVDAALAAAEREGLTKTITGAPDWLEALELCEDALSDPARLDDGTPSIRALIAARAVIARVKSL